ncbi:hypothetical protein BC830DRAFT_1174127 [Chytriomyces sp. MP71]|nr:hypothetical protein BC830DRAFT_1174127 [Chytriomyces sp. MP71]
METVRITACTLPSESIPEAAYPHLAAPFCLVPTSPSLTASLPVQSACNDQDTDESATDLLPVSSAASMQPTSNSDMPTDPHTTTHDLKRDQDSLKSADSPEFALGTTTTTTTPPTAAPSTPSAMAIGNLVSTSRVSSCEDCRKQKKRCSREYPSCSNCISRNVVCVYTGSVVAAPAHAPAQPQPASKRPRLAGASNWAGYPQPPPRPALQAAIAATAQDVALVVGQGNFIQPVGHGVPYSAAVNARLRTISEMVQSGRANNVINFVLADLDGIISRLNNNANRQL